MKSSKVKTIFIIISMILIAVIIGGAAASLITKTTPKDWFDKSSGTSTKEPDNQMKPIDSTTPVTLRAGDEGQHLYINTDETALSAFKEYASEIGMFLIVASSLQEADSQWFDIIETGLSFAIMYDENNGITLMFKDESCVSIYDFTTKEFGCVDEDNSSILTVTVDGEIIVADDVLDYYEIDAVYIYPMINLIPDDFEGDLDKDSLCSVEEINKIFAFSSFGN